jgi:hypothetical protein
MTDSFKNLGLSCFLVADKEKIVDRSMSVEVRSRDWKRSEDSGCR